MGDTKVNERLSNKLYPMIPPETETDPPGSVSPLLKRFEALETTLEEIKGLLYQIIEPSLYKQIRIEEIARKFAQGDKTALRQWNREQKQRAQKC